MDAALVTALGDELYTALIARQVVTPLSERHPDMTIDDAYQVQRRMIARRLEKGERVIGKKIGVTSAAVQDALGVRQPDFGHMLDGMLCQESDPVPMARLIQPRAEGELAFVMKRRVAGPGVTGDDVLAATEGVMTCFEIVDSRIRDWKVKIQDTVADNASCGVFFLGDRMVDPRAVDLVACSMVLEKNGAVACTGTGAATLGSPVNALVWLANTLGDRGLALEAGDIVLSGALGPLIPVAAGDDLRVSIDGVGGCSVRFR
jgi:2-oxopent-4-enoate/cis-2-oxohex-4-enoate hydratase